MHDEYQQDIHDDLSSLLRQMAALRLLVEQQAPCTDLLRVSIILRQTLRRLDNRLLERHVHICVPHQMKASRKEPLIRELVQLYALTRS